MRQRNQIPGIMLKKRVRAYKLQVVCCWWLVLYHREPQRMGTRDMAHKNHLQKPKQAPAQSASTPSPPLTCASEERGSFLKKNRREATVCAHSSQVGNLLQLPACSPPHSPPWSYIMNPSSSRSMLVYRYPIGWLVGPEIHNVDAPAWINSLHKQFLPAPTWRGPELA